MANGKSRVIKTLIILTLLFSPFITPSAAYVTEIHSEDGSVELQGTPQEIQNYQEIQQHQVMNPDGSSTVYLDKNSRPTTPENFQREADEIHTNVMLIENQRMVEHRKTQKESGISDELLSQAEADVQALEAKYQERKAEERKISEEREQWHKAHQVLVSREKGEGK